MEQRIRDGFPPVERVRLSDIPPLAPALIEGVLRQGHKMYVTGPSKAGKTFLSIELAEAVAAGEKWIGLQCGQGRVLYCNFEVDSASFAHRLRDVAEARGTSFSVIEENMDVWNMRGHSKKLTDIVDPLLSRVRQGDYSLVVLDPIYKLMGGSENDAAVVTEFGQAVDKIAEEGCSVVYVHHHSKGVQSGKSSMDRGSGSGVFARDSDAILDLIEVDVPDEAAIHAEGASGWRVSPTLREFGFMEPFEVWWKHPKHTRDEMGDLSGSEAKTPGGQGGSSDKWKKKVSLLEGKAGKWFKEHPGERLPRKTLMEKLSINDPRTFENRMEKSTHYRTQRDAESGIVYVVPIQQLTSMLDV